MRINHNISAKLANVSLKRADNNMSASLQRLSSGYKINKAADDSAGLAISNKMRTQIRALEQASRNADDGVSVIQTAEGALAEIQSMLQRCRELSVQAGNDTLTVSDREATQQEVDELMNEIDRIAGETEFNGIKLLDGSCSRVVTCQQMGARPLGVSEGVEAGAYTFTVNSTGGKAVGDLQYSLGHDGEININGTIISVYASDTDADVYAKVLQVSEMMDIDVNQTASGVLQLSSRAKGSVQQIIFRGTGDTHDIVARGTDAQIALGNGFSGQEGIRSNGGMVTIYDSSGFEMSFDLDDSGTGQKTFTVYDTGVLKFQIGANETQELWLDLKEVSCQSLGLKEFDGDSFVNLCSQWGATHAISSFDAALEKISAYRAMLGAKENRLESAISSLDNTDENITKSMSRIKDTDMAKAMTDYTQQSVLSQAATSMLAQANNRPQQVLSLIQS